MGEAYRCGMGHGLPSCRRLATPCVAALPVCPRRRRAIQPDMVSGLFGIGYGVQRFFVEFFREPDEGIGFVALDWMTMGQILSLPMIIAGIVLMIMAYKKPSQVNS
jgi:prolipoprotein diacylglyceryltransferase